MTTFLQKTNNAKSTLVHTISNSATTLEVADISVFPTSGDFHLTLWNKTVYPDPSDDSNMEIVKVTDISSGASEFTIVRGQEGTSARTHVSGDNVELLLTVESFTELETAVQTIETTISSLGTTYVPYTGASSDLILGSNQALLGGTTQVFGKATIDLAPNTIIQWKLNDNAASTTVVDYSGNNRNGTSSVNTSTFTTTGHVDSASALQFSTSGEYILSSICSVMIFQHISHHILTNFH